MSESTVTWETLGLGVDEEMAGHFMFNWQIPAMEYVTDAFRQTDRNQCALRLERPVPLEMWIDRTDHRQHQGKIVKMRLVMSTSGLTQIRSQVISKVNINVTNPIEVTTAMVYLLRETYRTLARKALSR